MKHWTTRIGIVIGSLSLFVVGCEQPETGEVAPGEEGAPLVEEAAETPEAGGREDHHDKHGKRAKGPGDMLMKKALRDLDLSDEQRAKIEALSDGGQRSDEGRTAHEEFRAALAAGVRAGKLDTALINDKLAALEQLGNAKRDQMFANLNTLHQTLTSDQRATLVASIRDKADKWQGKHDAHDDGDESAPKRGKADKRGGKFGKFGKDKAMHLMRGLDLSEEQRTAVRDAMQDGKPSREDKGAKRDKMRQKMTAMMDAFASDSFDAKALAADDDGSNHMRDMLDRKVAMVTKLIGVLDETQRETLATNLEKAKHDKRGKRGLRGKPDRRGKPGVRQPSETSL